MQIDIVSLEVICLVLFSPILGFPGDSVAKSPPDMQEIQVQFLGLENPLEKEMVTHSSMLVWRIPWTEEPGRLQSTGSQKSQT